MPSSFSAEIGTICAKSNAGSRLRSSGSKFGFLEEIDFVQQQEGFDLELSTISRTNSSPVPNFCGDIHDEQHEVAAFERVIDLLHHALVELVLRLVDAGSIHENTCPAGRLALRFTLTMPVMRLRVVCALWVTMASFSPTSD